MSKDIELYGDERESKGRVEGLVEGRVEGQDAQARKTALNLAKTGMTPQQIADAIDYSVERVEEWLNLQTA